MSVESIEVGQGFYKNPEILKDIIQENKELFSGKSFYTTMINDFEGYINTINVLVKSGYDVVPHIPVKSLSKEKIIQVLNLCKQTNNKTALILGGGQNKIVDYTSTLHFLKEDKDILKGMKKICFAGHPRAIGKFKNLNDHIESLVTRVNICSSLGIDYGILTQLEFSRGKILEYIPLLEKHGIPHEKVTLGITSTKSVMEMYKYSKLCGFGFKDMLSFTPSVLPLLFSGRKDDEKYSFRTHLYSFGGMKKSIIPYLKKTSS